MATRLAPDVSRSPISVERLADQRRAVRHAHPVLAAGELVFLDPVGQARAAGVRRRLRVVAPASQRRAKIM